MLRITTLALHVAEIARLIANVNTKIFSDINCKKNKQTSRHRHHQHHHHHHHHNLDSIVVVTLAILLRLINCRFIIIIFLACTSHAWVLLIHNTKVLHIKKLVIKSLVSDDRCRPTRLDCPLIKSES